MTAKTEGDEEEVALTSAKTKRMRATSDSCRLANSRATSDTRERRAVEARVASVYFARTLPRHV